MTVGGRRPSAGANLSARAHRLEEERTPALRIIFEPRAPWVERVEKAVTQPRSNPAAPLNEWVETDSRWFKPQIQNTSPVKTARQVRVYLTNVEMMRKTGNMKRSDLGPLSYCDGRTKREASLSQRIFHIWRGF